LDKRMAGNAKYLCSGRHRNWSESIVPYHFVHLEEDYYAFWYKWTEKDVNRAFPAAAVRRQLGNGQLNQEYLKPRTAVKTQTCIGLSWT
jgi:hypothetical protein